MNIFRASPRLFRPFSFISVPQPSKMARFLGTMHMTPITHNFPDKLRITEHFFRVPLNYQQPEGRTIDVFARSVTRRETPITELSKDESVKKSQKPWIVYLQGGPGMSCPSPQRMPITNTLLDRGYQILYLDQRGTGLSSCITEKSLPAEVEKQADYLKLFRADNIVRDCETIRKQLTADYPEDQRKWSLIGQSFGGFCIWSYLSLAPEGVREAFSVGGIPPVGKTADEVYAATSKKVIQRNIAYYEKYPEDVTSVQYIVDFIAETRVELPGGGILTPARLLGLGIFFGFHGGMDTVHEIIFKMRTELEQWGMLLRPTLAAVESLGGFDNHVIYALLHEPIYCSGPESGSSSWAAQRVISRLPQYKWLEKRLEEPAYFRRTGSFSHEPLYFTGEMVFPHTFDDYPELIPLRPVANVLAETNDWPPLYDEQQLAKNKVPVYAATYVDDMYVDFELAQETVQKTANVKQWITNCMYHNAISAKTEKVLSELFRLRDDCMD